MENTESVVGGIEYASSTQCEECRNRRLRLSEGENGRIGASFCPCAEEEASWDEREKLQEAADALHRAEIPNHYLAASASNGVHPEILAWVKKYKAKHEIPNTLFLYGGTGAGKTHSAIHALLSSFPNTISILYLPTYKFLELRNEYLDHRFSDDKVEKSRSTKVFRNYHRFLKTCDFLVLDELGQEKLAPDESKLLFQLLDARYSAGKVTICISNHSDDKKRTLEGKLLTNLVGERIASRLKSAQQIYFAGSDMRVHEGSEVISKEEIENFMVPAKILTHDEDTHHIMNWLTRNPAFETVSPKRREELTEVVDEKVRDKARPLPDFYQDVWIAGDRLTIEGPVCDHEDKKIYALLLKELARSHSKNLTGLELTTSYGQILDLQGRDYGGRQVELLRRQLDRLARMMLSFQSANGAKWVGALISSLYENGQGRARKVHLTFNPYMIAFYQASAYTTFNRLLSEKLIGDGSAFYLFFVSHDRQKNLKPVPFEKCKKLLGMSDDISRKAALRRISKATKDLITYDILGSGTQFVKDSLHPVAGHAL